MPNGVLQRGSVNWGNRTSGSWKTYTDRKAEWIRKHPNASHREIDKAARAIAASLGL